MQLAAPFVIDAYDAFGRVVGREQARLCFEVGFERVVVVEVVLREV